MKTLPAAAVLLLALAAPAAQEESPPTGDLLRSAQEWLRDNVDEEALAEFGVDSARLQLFLGELSREFEGPHVYNLAALRESATRLLPVLHQFEETRPYAAWLHARLDYLIVAERLLLAFAPPPPARPPTPLPNPPADLQRQVWIKELERRPPPPRAGDRVPRLKEIFTAERTPPELVWVAEVESAFNPRALSPAGAAGLFQLMPVTARELDLSLRPRDERYEPDKNARAAARYLRRLHDRFGDWRLALAAYNAGPTRVTNLLKSNNAHTFDAISPHLPAETQMYVPKVEAVLLRREGMTLAGLRAPGA
jgi:membrane-bound lytic murein transglycosylase D